MSSVPIPMPNGYPIPSVNEPVVPAHDGSRMVESLLVGRSSAIVQLRSLVGMAAPSGLPVLIQGPTGAGKEVVATALHEQGHKSGAFVAFNVCAIGDAVFEDALFGHVRGAFTGAVSD